MQPDLHNRAPAAHTLYQFKILSPLTHCMTNEVAQSFTVNTLPALGVSPATVIELGEASQSAAIASASLVNVGTLTWERAAAMRVAVKQAHHIKIPWTLDPVAVDALEFRRHFCLELLSLQPAVIRDNASEILTLVGMNGSGCGVDIADTAAVALPAAQALACQVGTTVVVTGEMDYITDGQRTVRVGGGDSLMTRVVGTGCALSAVVVASCALRDDRLDNVAPAYSWMKQAGQIATEQSNGLGSFVPTFLDAFYDPNAQERA